MPLTYSDWHIYDPPVVTVCGLALFATTAMPELQLVLYAVVLLCEYDFEYW